MLITQDRALSKKKVLASLQVILEFFFFFFYFSKKTGRSGDGKRNISWGWPCQSEFKEIRNIRLHDKGLSHVRTEPYPGRMQYFGILRREKDGDWYIYPYFLAHENLTVRRLEPGHLEES